MARPGVKCSGDKLPFCSNLRVEGTLGRIIESKDKKGTGPLRFNTWNKIEDPTKLDTEGQAGEPKERNRQLWD